MCISKLAGDSFRGYSWGQKCGAPYKGESTVEGIASSVALVERLTSNNDALAKLGNEENDPRAVLKILPDDHEIWNHTANAIANLCVNLALLVSIERIVIGGGIMKRKILLQMVRERTVLLLNGYLGSIQEIVEENSCHNRAIATMDEFITTSREGDQAGLIGAFALAKEAFLKKLLSDHNLVEGAKNETCINTVDTKFIDLRSFLVGALLGITIFATVNRKSRT